MRFIAVDDEPLLLSHLVKCIQDSGSDAEVLGFRKPSEAIEYVSSHEIDVAFLDVQMRGMTGLELGKRLKLMQPNLDIIFCTGYSEYIYDAQNDVRCSGYLLKPIDKEDVKTELDKWRQSLT